MDGNRRFAKTLNLNPWKGHEYGEKKVFSLLEWCKELEIKEVTIYAFSQQNKNRPEKELKYLMDLFEKTTNKILKDKEVIKSGTKITILGDKTIFSKELQEKLKELEQKTKQNKKYYLNIALGYGGREEIISATKKIAKLVQDKKLEINEINEKEFEKHLYSKNEPDIIIRTGGDCRTSNFLPWQSTYSEWFFIKKKWPEFTRKDLEQCINDYKKRERRFGK